MHTHETEHETTSLGTAAKLVAERASTLVRLELELAALELKRKVAALGIGIGLALGAVLFLLYALGFGLAAARSRDRHGAPVVGRPADRLRRALRDRAHPRRGRRDHVQPRHAARSGAGDPGGEVDQ